MLFRQLSHKIGIKDGGREVDGKMAKDKAPEGGIDEMVSSASVNEKKKNSSSPKSGVNGEEQMYLRKICEVESMHLGE